MLPPCAPVACHPWRNAEKLARMQPRPVEGVNKLNQDLIARRKGTLTFKGVFTMSRIGLPTLLEPPKFIRSTVQHYSFKWHSA